MNLLVIAMGKKMPRNSKNTIEEGTFIVFKYALLKEVLE